MACFDEFTMSSQSGRYGSLLTQALKGIPDRRKVSKSSTPLKDASYNTPKNATELQGNSRTGHQDLSNQPESSTEASNNASAPERSHELLLPAPKSESTKSKDIESYNIAQQKTDSLWATENEEDIDTDEETMNWLDQELAKQNCEESIKSSNILYASMPVPVEVNMVAKETVKPHPHLVVPHRGKSEVIVHRGFDTFPHCRRLLFWMSASEAIHHFRTQLTI